MDMNIITPPSPSLSQYVSFAFCRIEILCKTKAKHKTTYQVIAQHIINLIFISYMSRITNHYLNIYKSSLYAWQSITHFYSDFSVQRQRKIVFNKYNLQGVFSSLNNIGISSTTFWLYLITCIAGIIV